MKFLVISSFKDTASTLPPAVLRQLWEANMELVNQARKAGKILEIYWVPGWNRGVSIEDKKSAEEVVQTLSGSPMFAFLNFEVYPLADFDESRKVLLESVKAAEKMMPGIPK